jgi:hypothetical protein
MGFEDFPALAAYTLLRLDFLAAGPAEFHDRNGKQLFFATGAKKQKHSAAQFATTGFWQH